MRLFSLVSCLTGQFCARDLRQSVVGFPQTNTTVNVTTAEWKQIETLGLRVYIEFPSSLPTLDAFPETSHASTFGVAQTEWERVVVTGNLSSPSTPLPPKLSLLHPHKFVDYLSLPLSLFPSQPGQEGVLLVLARVAGYDQASLGLPPSNLTYPLLSIASKAPLMVAATQLSRARQRRFAPSNRWQTIFSSVLSWVSNGSWQRPDTPNSSLHEQPLWNASVSPSYPAIGPLPPSAELDAVTRGVRFYQRARLLPSAAAAVELARLKCYSSASTSSQCAALSRLDPPYDGLASGQGQLGVLEGFSSTIGLEGGAYIFFVACKIFPQI